MSRKRKGVDLDSLIAEAITDAHDNEEAEMGFSGMLEERLRFPFKARVVGEEVEVTGVVDADDGVAAVCVRGEKEYLVPLLSVEVSLDLHGREWVDAYRQYRRRSA
ncbi:MAG: calcium-binding protein [Nitrososphaerales archaeon]